MIFEEAFSGPFCHLRDQFGVLRASEGRGVTASALVEGDFMDERLDRMRIDFPDADPRALVSWWTLWYFHGLVVPATVVTVALDRTLTLDLDHVRLIVEGGPVPAVRLPDPGVPRCESVFDGFHGLVRDHLEPAITSLADRYRVAPRMLWGNAAHYLEWALGTLEKQEQTRDAARRARPVLEQSTWPDGWTNPMSGAIRYLPGNGTPVRRRRVCCLRNRLEGVEGCGTLCPLEDC